MNGYSQGILYVANLLPNAVGFYLVLPTPQKLLILNSLVLATGSVAGLACVWAGLGRPHWFWRIATIAIVASLALLIPAYELLIWFFIQAVVTVPPLLLARRRNAGHEWANGVAPSESRRTRCRRLQWSLRDQLLIWILLSGIIAAAVRIPSGIWATWVSLVLVGLMFAICTLVGTWAAFGKRHRWLRSASCPLPHLSRVGLAYSEYIENGL